MATINDWFENKDYGVGIAILSKYSKNRFLIQNLVRKENPGKLEYELRKVAYSNNVVIAEKAIPEEIIKVKPVESHSDQVIDQMNNETISNRLKIVRNNRTVDYSELPKEMQARWNQNHDGYKEIRSIHEKLKLMEKAKREDREPLTMRIAYLDDLIRSNWTAIDAWSPETAITTKDLPQIDHKRINANRKFICTNIAKLSKVNDEVKRAMIIENLELRYNELVNAGEEFAPDTIADLKILGVKC